MIKFLHIADLHMDRSFEGISDLHPSFAKKLHTVNDQVLNSIYEQAYQQQVDLVILAGDNFHQTTSSLATQRVFTNFLTRLQNINIPVCLIFGNHDYYDSKRYWFDFPDNVTLWNTSEVQTHDFTSSSGERVTISGFSYTSPWLNEDMTTYFPKKQPSHSDYHIGIYHGNRGTLNKAEQQQYAPFSLTSLLEKNYDYWALGHIHVPTILDANNRVVYPGTPQGHNRKERQVKGVVLVELDHNESKLEWLPVNHVSYEKKVVSLKSCHDLSQVQHMLITLSKEVFAGRRTELLFLELSLTDHVHFSEELKAKLTSNELAEMIQQVVAIEELTISKIALQHSKINQLADLKPIQLPIYPSQIEAIIQHFTDEEIFNDITSDLTNHKLFNELVTLDEELRNDVIEEMKTNFYQKIAPGGHCFENNES
ncbi:metallophosphoesterase family protein [Vagococcus intermedius]|uniref:DNA repair exonuclease n=1 Tax=Vagococcus intermedius TaxID=2991418 RepID=A0AAF0I8R2_9ENTE|nr:DNA repair exonuclease [Vagococcus intermedius]WEG74251.1 DNA repair exonuclease [Vagococcus intermedius]WEG76333.1 DNA repair exonuclease [Vagococcus intermedius]